MRRTYQVIAYLIALEVAVQASLIAFAVFGLGKWMEDGNTLTPDMVGENAANPADFTGAAGFGFHALNGYLISLVALALLIVSAFAKVTRGIALAGVVLGLVILQIALGTIGANLPAVGLLHGLNALAVFVAALHAGRRAGSGSAVTA
jgi:hypothetical protein